MAVDMVNHPPHYKAVSGIGKPILKMLGVTDAMLQGECIDALEWLESDGASFARLSAIKYLWRCGLKGDATKAVEDLRKAVWYLRRMNNVRYAPVIKVIEHEIEFLQSGLPRQCDN